MFAHIDRLALTIGDLHSRLDAIEAQLRGESPTLVPVPPATPVCRKCRGTGREPLADMLARMPKAPEHPSDDRVLELLGIERRCDRCGGSGYEPGQEPAA